MEPAIDTIARARRVGNRAGTALQSRSHAPLPPVPPRAMPKPTAGAPLGLSLLLALAPKCPLCLAAHGSVLGVLGIGELAPGEWTRPLVAVSLLALLGLLAYRAPTRRGYAPLLLAAAGAALLAAEAFHAHPAAEHAHAHAGGAGHAALATWGGLALVAAAAAWNAWPRRGGAGTACTASVPGGC